MTSVEDTRTALPDVAGIVRRHVAERPERTALVMDDRQVTWRELGARSARVANAFVASGVGPQDRIAFCDKNSLEYFDVTFGAAMANAVVVALNWRLAPPEMEGVLNDAGAKVLIVGPDFYDHVAAIEPNLTSVALIVALGDHPRWIGFDDWVGAQPATDPHVPTRPSDVCMQLYTSGTTGLPKGVMISNAAFLALVANVSPEWDVDADSVSIVCMPLFHIGGCGWAMVCLYAGGSAVVVREFAPNEILDILIEHRITNALFVPAMLQVLPMVAGAGERDYSSLRSINYGASPITTATLVTAMKTFGCKFRQLYGMTETSGVISCLPPADHDPDGPREHLLRSAGRPYPFVGLRIVDLESGRDCASGEVGEVVMRAAHNMIGYWNKPDETAKTIDADGWLYTGDAGYVDAEGFLYLTDRVKDMIVSGGENVYPTEVENALALHPAVAEVGVIGVPHDRWGETVKAMVVLRDGHTATAPELIAFSKERLAGYKCPTSVDFVDALPRNPSGKILKKDLRAPFWEGRGRGVN